MVVCLFSVGFVFTVLRRTIVSRTHDTHQNLLNPLFLLAELGSDHYILPQVEKKTCNSVLISEEKLSKVDQVGE